MAARAFCPRLNPSFGTEKLEVPADGGLWELEDGSELVDRQLIPFECEQESAPRRIGECRHLSKQGRCPHFTPSVHPD